jgi:CheY-like chemotaxis protein
VQSVGQGGGATFTVTLPCRQAHLRAPAASALASRPESWSGVGPEPGQRRDALAGVRILLVDDDEEARDTLRMALEMAGAVVDDADSAPRAIRALRENWPDVLLSDIAMPGEDGYELIRRVGGLRGEHTEPLRSIANARRSTAATSLGEVSGSACLA